ncbi:hypothetical protein PspLS_07027 [Pyricularia sp. CBS 133598]|nr:hypothetical protein PspLS_07027 [Pyricularia sp. CBS 133598]
MSPSFPEPIAVIGSACRFPGDLTSPSKLWNFLLSPRDLQREVPKNRFNVEAFHHPDGSHHGRTNARHGYFLEDLHGFDAQFFNIQAGEAESMDPQQRQLLEATYEALCAAGLTIESMKGSDTAVYVGIMTHDFELTKVGDLDAIPTYLATGAATSIASNRLSYFFDWHGPSMTIDTACSSSLVAVHHAVQQLRSGVSKVAVAAGANLMLSPLNFITESKLSMLSPTGRSRMWDASADGYARGEGIASVVLKTLSQALADGDKIECLIRETGVGQDGRTAGITMPSNVAQAALIRATYARAGLDLSKPEGRPQFFEAHGTGTPAGDPQEAEAIATAFFPSAEEDAQNLYVGSIKTVIGHTEGTAGIAGLLRCSLAVQNGVLPPNMLLDTLSPRVEPFCKHLRVPTDAMPWPAVVPGQPRRASVNSFGFGGTNAHAIVEEYRPETTPPASASHASICTLPLVFSARTKRSLKANMQSMLEFLRINPEVDITDVAWTLLQKRSALPLRQSITGSTVASLTQALENAINSDNLGVDFTPKTSDVIRIMGIFTGQGAQWPAMLKQLLINVPYVQSIIAELDNSLQSLPAQYRPTWTLSEQVFLEGKDSNVRQAAFSQPLCAAVQIVLVRLLQAAGIRFSAMVGHSSGEIGCAFAAGFISAQQAIRIAYLRGIVSTQAGSPSGQVGAMLAVGISLDDARELVGLEAFEGRVCIAACNSPESITLSGDNDALEEIVEILQDEQKFARMLLVDKAYHSHHMLPCSDPYITALNQCGCGAPDGQDKGLKWYSSVREGKVMGFTDVTPEYWRDNLVSPVLFSQALEQASLENGLDVAVEVGPHPSLKAPASTTISICTTEEIPYTGCLQRDGDDVAAFQAALGYIWERFAALKPFDATALVKAMYGAPPTDMSKLVPAYVWDHTQVLWAESRAAKAALHGPRPHLMLGTLLPSSTAVTLQWRNFFRPRDHDWMQGHELQGQPVFPAAGYVLMAMEAALRIAGDKPANSIELLDLSIDKAVTFDDADSMAELTLTATVTASSDDQVAFDFTIASCLARESSLSISAAGKIVVTLTSLVSLPASIGPPPHANAVDIKLFYRELDQIGYDYSNNYRCVYNMTRSTGRASGHMAHPPLTDGDNAIVLHPANLDLAFQTVMGAYSSPGDKRMRSLVGNKRYIYWHDHVIRIAREGKHLFYKPEWEQDTEQVIDQLLHENWYHPHLRLAKLVSDNSIPTIRENKNPFIWMNEHGLLTEFYTSYLTSGPTWEYGQHLIKQIAHRFQNMDILEIGGGTGSATASILAIPELNFNSYTFTDISPAFFEKARDKFSAHLDRMEFRKLDITKAPSEQGFKTQGYDMIVASSVLHATPKLAETMANARTLLRPGGHVVICEATNKDHMRVGYLFGLFADWWAGVDEGRNLDPFATREEWDAIFKQTGFSGIDSVTTERESHIFPNTLLSTHAVTPEQLRLDAPLAASTKSKYPQLVIVGGGPRATSVLTKVKGLLPNRTPLVVPTLCDLGAARTEPKATYVVLSELDRPVFEDLDESNLSALKTLLFNLSASSILWLTEDAWVSNPRQAMGIGMLRTVRLENPDVAFQSLDVDNLDQLDAGFLAEQILRLEEGTPENVLWTLEPEICVVKGRPHVPRIKQDAARNNRLNSTRRPIVEQVDARTTPVALLPHAQAGTKNAPALVATRTSRPLGIAPEAKLQTVRVHHATAKAVRVQNLGYFHVAVGTTPGGAFVLALAEENASIVTVPAKRTFPIASTSATALLSAVANLIAQGVVGDAPAGSSVLLFAPPKFCFGAIIRAAEACKVRVHTAATHHAPVPGAIVLHPLQTDAAIRQKLPQGIAALYDLSPATGASELSRRLARVTGQCARDSSFVYRDETVVYEYVDEALEASQLKLVADAAGAGPDADVAESPMTKAAEAQVHLTRIETVVDWQAEAVVPARVSPVDRGTLFVKDKTYLLVGLSQSMGRSIATWIVKHGGCHVVLSSRNPEKPDQAWLEDMERDASNAESVDAGLATLRNVHNLPPVGGLAYGPLVLKDALLNNMDLDTMNVVLKSKVPGAKILHDRFCDPTNNPLDFFVMFSSAALFGGNPGQANYTAANAYLQALGQYRRSKGLVASTIHIGAVMGIGYLTRNSREAEFQEKSDVDTLGEAEFLTLFAEAVVSGRRVDGADGVCAKTAIDMADTEIGSGIPAMESRHKETIKFYHDPRFGNLRTPEGRGDSGGGGEGKMSVREMLLKAETMEAVRRAISECLSDKMRGVLHIPPEESVATTAPLLDQGIDSLGAITVASWFSKQLLVEIPILQILSGASIDELATEAASRLSPAATPLVTGGGPVPATPSRDSATSGSEPATPLTPFTPTGDDETKPKDGVVREIALSLTQEYSYIRQASLPDVTISHNTIGVIMSGHIDTAKLSSAVTAAINRHEILRTAIQPASSTSPAPLLRVLDAPTWALRDATVPSRTAAEAELAKLQKEPYDLAGGETFKIALFSWSATNHLLVFAYHRLAGDGSTTENLVAELSQLYEGATLPPAPQYTDFAIKQRTMLPSGGMDASIAYWTNLHTPIPAPLPPLSLPAAKGSRNGPVSWDQHEAMARLSPVLAFRIKERTKKLGTTPMTFYLATYATLLGQLANKGEVTVGLADTNRPSISNLSTMGYFANLLPLRLSSADSIVKTVECAKESVRQAMAHAFVPHALIEARLGLGDVPADKMVVAPLFQAVFDYRQGAAESGMIGGASITEVLASRERTPYDVVLEMSNDPTKDPLVTVKLQSSLYGVGDAEVFLGRYVELLTRLNFPYIDLLDNVEFTPPWYTPLIATAIFIAAVTLALRDDYPGVPIINPKRATELTASSSRAEFFSNSVGLYKLAKQKFNDRPYRVIAENGEILILPPRYVAELKFNPKLRFQEPTEIDNHGWLPGFDPIRANPKLPRIINTYVTRQLSSFTAPMSEEAAEGLSAVFTDSTEWSTITQFSVMTVVSRMSARVFMGKDLCNDQGWTKAALSYTTYLFEYRNVLSEWPMFLRTLVYKLKPNSRILRDRLQHCREVLRPYLCKREAVIRQALEIGEKNPYNDAMRWFAEEMGDKYDPAASQISLSLAAIHATTDLLFQTMIDIAKHPELFAPLRQEAIEVLNMHGLTKVAFERLSLADGCCKESQRIRPVKTTFFQRDAAEDIHLSDGFVIKKGTRVGTPWPTAMLSEEYYDHPERYDPYRYIKMREKDPSCESRTHLVNVSHDHFGFGHGYHACPGRFFAANEIKIALAHLLLKYDWKLAEGTANLKPVVKGHNFVCNPGAKLLVRRRKEELDLSALKF